ncbi:SDR family NAD(P)-dependent oxidoreductase [Streptomyces sp. NPDC051243]|uniref:SDR family NAD(P)-dependent oxidoreductase n=1 Tax=Streptomyces sp. NPDC051243 TaxID=3365646 RepID=UPI00379DC325
MTQDLKGKTIVITGAGSGIGAAAARRLARRGATVVPVGRSADETAAIAAELGTSPLVADYSRLGEVRALADQLLARHRTIDVLAHNAGGFFPDRRTTEDGHERTLQVNYLAPFLLQSLLHERLSVSRAHVIVTSSFGHWTGRIRLDDLSYEKRSYSTSAAYSDSKLAGLLFAREIARRTPQSGITAVAFHPGVVNSNIGTGAAGMTNLIYNTRLGRATMISNDKGAAPLVHLATLPDPHSVNGQYFNKMKANSRTSKQARDGDLVANSGTTRNPCSARLSAAPEAPGLLELAALPGLQVSTGGSAQVHCWTVMPSAVDAPLTSRHLPLS